VGCYMSNREWQRRKAKAFKARFLNAVAEEARLELLAPKTFCRSGLADISGARTRRLAKQKAGRG
jgi:hypothetical protein